MVMKAQYRDLMYRQGLKEYRRRRKCSVDGCIRFVSNNHSISRSLLKELTEDNHVYELYLRPFPELKIGLERVGIINSTIFRDLCPYHDNLIYQSVDKGGFDIHNYNNIMMLNYRALRNEWFRKSITFDVHRNCIDKVKGSPVATYLMYESLKSLPFNFKSVNWYMDCLEKEKKSNTEEFLFEVFQYPYFDLAATELFTYEPNPDVKRDLYKTTGCFVPFSEIFLHIIPRKKEEITYVIVSSHSNDKYLLEHYIERYIDRKLDKNLSDILLIQTEKWVCSKEFKAQFVDGKIDFMEVFKVEMPMNVFNRYTEENLFP